MNLNGIDLNLLLVFEAILAEGSMTRAAERLDVSQPTVSNALNRLRQALNDPLFIRATTGMEPTPKAQSLAEPVAQALTTLRHSFQNSIEFDAKKHKQHFRIGLSDYTSTILAPALVAHLRNHAPNITLSLKPLNRNSAHEALKSGKLDLLITDDFAGPGIFQQRLYDETFICLSKKSKRNNIPITMQEFLQNDHLLYSLDGTGPGIVDKKLSEIGEKRNITLRVAYSSLIPEIIASTNLLATIPKRLADKLIQDKRLQTLESPLALPEYSVKQYWHEKFHKDPGLQWLRKIILKTSSE